MIGSMTRYLHQPLDYQRLPEQRMLERSEQFLASMKKRRSVRDFSSDAVPESIIRNAISAAGTAPSGANMQPWHFVAISDAAVKKQIREAAEAEERELYEHRASDEWLGALAPLGTDAEKPFLETAPWLIAIFAKKYTLTPEGERRKHYYTPESVGIATGLLITALHDSGLATLTHTPSPMGFLKRVLQRPDHEKPFILLVTGYPAVEAQVPSIEKYPLDDILTIV